ncbi:hypothetical protein FRB99_007777 [Tulasnella sp. 403]|nr:hypothetical protein FRB99_007777 [Tulasnella sp. 403]
MATIKVGDTVPSGTFKYIPWSQMLDDRRACGIPINFSSDEWKGKKVVIISVPGAFTFTCHTRHLPPYLEKYDQLKSKGVDAIYVLAANDPFVMSAWGVSLGLQDKIIPISDTYAKWSGEIGLQKDLTEGGMGIRTARYVIILDDLKVVSVEIEEGREIVKTDVDTTLSKL